jgi:hypothetical protein
MTPEEIAALRAEWGERMVPEPKPSVPWIKITTRLLIEVFQLRQAACEKHGVNGLVFEFPRAEMERACDEYLILLSEQPDTISVGLRSRGSLLK